MKRSQINKSIKTKELQLRFWDRLSYYWLSIFLCLIPSTILYSNFSVVTGRITTRFDGVAIWFIFISYAGAILLYWVQKRKLKFQVEETDLSRDELMNVIQGVAKESEWFPYVIRENLIIAKTNPGFSSDNWGEQITIIIDKNTVLINSICDPDKGRLLVPTERNKENEQKLLNRINKLKHSQTRTVVGYNQILLAS